jgi:hypothetical protein
MQPFLEGDRDKAIHLERSVSQKTRLSLSQDLKPLMMFDGEARTSRGSQPPSVIRGEASVGSEPPLESYMAVARFRASDAPDTLASECCIKLCTIRVPSLECLDDRHNPCLLVLYRVEEG